MLIKRVVPYKKYYMKRKKQFPLSLLLVVSMFTALLPVAPIKAAEEINSEAYKAIVKVKTYSAVYDNALDLIGEGSGVIINSGGLVLTNDHVVSLRSDYDNSDYVTSYQICLTETISNEPSCDYLAKLVARDEEMDIALLQIVSYPKGREIMEFPFLKLTQTDLSNINDAVTAIGYPSIGGDTVTITQGVISGKADKYNKKWLKTDAVISFGSSGGAAISASGEVLGITTEVYSDVSGELGYILSAASLKDWIQENMYVDPQASSLFNRLADLTNKQKILVRSNKFINLYPYFSIDKPGDWTFKHQGEDSVDIVNENDQDSGRVSILMIKAPFLQDKNSVKNALLRKLNELGLSSVVRISKESDVKLDGNAAKLLTLSAGNNLLNSYLIPHKEYSLWVQYNYGKNDKDKAKIDAMIKSLKMSGAGPKFVQAHKYVSKTPKFSLTTTANWPILTQNNKVEPLELQNKTVKEAFVLFSINKMDDTEKNMTAAELLAAHKNVINSTNQGAADLDFKYVVEKSGTNFKINNSVKALYYIDGVEKNISQNKTLAFDRDYYVKIGDSMVNINLTVYTESRAVFNKAVTEFNKMLQGLSLK